MLTDKKAYNRDQEVEKLLEILSLWGWKDESYSYVKRYIDDREVEEYYETVRADSFNNEIYFGEGVLYLKNKSSYYYASIPLGDNLILATTKESPSFRSNILLEKVEEIDALYFYKNKEDVDKESSSSPAAAILFSPSLTKKEYANPLVFSFNVFETTQTRTCVYASDKTEALEIVKKHPERFKYTTTIEKSALQS